MQITKMKWLVSVGFSTIIASVTGTRISLTLDKHKAGGPDLSAGERGSGGLKPTRGAGLSLSAWPRARVQCPQGGPEGMISFSSEEDGR